LPEAFVPVRIVTADRLPRTADGKIERRGVQELIKRAI
jgi:acyl-coenzyme A synthetase/AMP-(fatty) acid ligase